MNRYLLALDQGTTSSRAILFDCLGNIVRSAQYEFRQIYPQAGYVEHDPLDILETQKQAAADVLLRQGVRQGEVAAIGVTNQRETTIVWEKATGRPVHNAIVWQCRRTAPMCEQLMAEGLTAHVQRTTGLIIDAYFSPPDTLYPRSYRKRAAAGRTRGAAVWHRGNMADLEPDGRACNGLFQCRAHDAV